MKPTQASVLACLLFGCTAESISTSRQGHPDDGGTANDAVSVVDQDGGTRSADGGFRHDGGAAGSEARFGELRADPTFTGGCSETLNTDAFTVDGNENTNPSNSPEDVQCSGGYTWRLASVLEPVPETGMPVGNTVDYVWRVDQGYGGNVVKGNARLGPDTRRMCTRYYLRLSHNYLDGGCDAGKFVDFKWEDRQLQMGSGGGSGLVWWASGWGIPVNDWGTGTLGLDDLPGEWVRLEACVSGNFVRGNGDFFTEAYVVRLSDGKRRDFARKKLTGRAGLDELVWLWIANNFRGNDDLTCPAENLPPQGWRENSHNMQAEWSCDDGQWIGPAFEVEGCTSSMSTRCP